MTDRASQSERTVAALERIADALEGMLQPAPPEPVEPPPCGRCGGKGQFAPGVDCQECGGSGKMGEAP